MSIVNTYFFSAALALVIVGRAAGQAAQSPFSTFGIGEKYGTALTHNQGMAGIGIGAPQLWFINNQNPAFLIYNGLTTFEAGILYESRNITGEQTDEKTQGGNMNYLVTSFPVKPGKWTTSVGLMPYTNVDYTLEYSDPIIGGTGNASVKENGSGGLTQVYWSNGVRLTRHLSVGLTGAYIFSSILNEYTNYVDVPSSAPFQVKLSERVYVRDFGFTAALGYRQDSIFGGEYQFSAGAVYSFATNLNATRDVTFSRTDFLDQIIDSLTLQSSRGQLYLPEEVGVGFSIAKGYRWLIGVDFAFQDWSKFRSLDSEDEEGLDQSWRLAVGGEITPDLYAVQSFFKRMTYRAGLSVEKYPFLANNKQVKDFGINFGLSLPAGRSSLDLAFRIGKRGNKSENILEESYYKVYFGITLNDQWFIKRKFD